MKKIISIVLVLVISLSLVACSNNSANSEVKNESTYQSVNIRLGGLKGPTSMGMVKLLDDNDNKQTNNTYDFTMAATADELTPKFIKGELDIVAIPANLGSVLYNKTNGGIKMLAVNMLGAIYIVQKGENTLNSLADLKGKTIYATGKGSTPEYVLSYLLSQNGLDIEKDLKIEWKSEPAETVAEISVKDNAIAMIPQPYLAVAQTKINNLNVALDLYNEWEKTNSDSKFITAAVFVRTDFEKENPQAVKMFLEEYSNSTNYVKENIDEASKLIDKYDIVKYAIAKKALPQCNIVCITDNEMKQAVSGYFQVLYNQNSASVGGKLPGDDFYLSYE